VWKRTSILPKRMSRDGQGEFYRRVIMNRLQNMTYDAIAQEHGVSRERCRQIWARFSKYCRKHGHSLERELYKKLEVL